MCCRLPSHIFNELVGNLQTFLTVRILENPGMRLHHDRAVIATVRFLEILCTLPFVGVSLLFDLHVDCHKKERHYD